MSLTDSERRDVLGQMYAQLGDELICPHCGEKDSVHPHDDGVSCKTEWGVSGAYVMCDSCGHTIDKRHNVRTTSRQR